MIAETAALRLGTTVAKAAGAWWLGGRRREQERELEMEELIRTRVSGIRLQREVRQQFEQITNAVFDRLEPNLRHAFERLEQGGQEAVVNAVTDTFTHADLSDDALLAANAQPAELTRRITRSVAPPVGLNEAETRLYEILFAECAGYYVSIVRGLPVFEERATAELLARTATLGAEIARILERLPDRSLFAPEGTDQDTGFRREYMELVSRDLDEVELFRRTSDQGAAPRIHLSVAYVSPRTTGDDGKRRRRTARALPSPRLEMSNWEERGGESSGMRVEAALSGTTRVLLRGEAGSGKTTLLRWLAIMASRGAFTGELADWNGLTPILVKLREYSGKTPPRPEAMLDGVAGHITGFMPRGWVERELQSGKVLLLIDGVDELLDRERANVRAWLRKLLGQYGDVRVIVTSRPAAAGAHWLSAEDFTPLLLGRMTPPDLAAFVRQWHQAVRALGGDELPCPAEEIPQYEQSLLTSLKDRAHLQSLAGTPLLAAMLCSMHFTRGRNLPRDRMELYRNALHTLVHERDADRNVPSAVTSKLSLGDKLVILRDLAWRLSDNNRTDIELDQAARHVAAKLRAMRHLDLRDLDGTTVLEQLRDRSGILRSPANGRLDFVHRTFQEYLAAEEAAEEDRIGNLVGHAHLDLWRETVIMAAGHANTRQREELIGGILDRAEAEPRHARTLRLLAAACQETLPSVPEGLAARLDEAVGRLLPARRETDPPALAAVGGSLLRRLPGSVDDLRELSEKAAAQTVRTVALIGGEEALQMLAGYVGDERDGVARALIEAWNYFDAEAYVDKVLCEVPSAGMNVSITHSAQLQAAKRLRSLKYLQVDYTVRDLTFLDGFPPLTGMFLSDVQGHADLSMLRSQPHLHVLGIFTGGNSSISGLSAIELQTELEWLGLPFSRDLDLGVLQKLPKLTDLSLQGISATTNLGPLNTCPGLKSLRLSGSGDVPQGFEELGRMTSLSNIYLYNCDANRWLQHLRSAPPALNHLALDECVVPDNALAFTQLERLISLSIDTCRTPDGQLVSAFDVPGVHTEVV